MRFPLRSGIAPTSLADAFSTPECCIGRPGVEKTHPPHRKRELEVRVAVNR